MTPKEISRVLVVDGEPAILRTLTVFLKMRGYDCHSAQSAEEAAGWIEENTAHIILIDLDTAGAGGSSVLDRLHRLGGLSQLVAMSAHPTVDKIIDAYQLGASDYLAKPFKNLDDVDVAVSHAAQRLARWRVILSQTLSEEGRA